jgi:hypothetical protein
VEDLKISFMKYIFIILTFLVLSCSHSKLEINKNPLVIEDTVILDARQKDWFTAQQNPSRGMVKVSIDNYTDSAKKFVILVKEVK